MRALKRAGIAVGAAVGGFVLIAASVLFLWPRPPDTTDPAIFAADGADLNYCDLPELDGNGPTAADIPKAYTPGCGWSRWPMPVLADCREPLAPDAADLRGLWRSRSGEPFHVERVEQCGDRVVVTAAGVIHDFHADGTVANGSRDVGLWCVNTWVAIEWRDKVLSFRALGAPYVIVERERVGEHLRFSYPGRGERLLERACRIPEAARTAPYSA